MSPASHELCGRFLSSTWRCGATLMPNLKVIRTTCTVLRVFGSLQCLQTQNLYIHSHWSTNINPTEDPRIQNQLFLSSVFCRIGSEQSILETFLHQPAEFERVYIRSDRCHQKPPATVPPSFLCNGHTSIQRKHFAWVFCSILCKTSAKGVPPNTSHWPSWWQNGIVWTIKLQHICAPNPRSEDGECKCSAVGFHGDEQFEPATFESEPSHRQTMPFRIDVHLTVSGQTHSSKGNDNEW